MTDAVGFTERDLRRLAGARSFERGLGYRASVSDLEIGDGTITATVDGTEAYRVELTQHPQHPGQRAHAAGLTGRCDCPYGQEGNFCKHCVAVGLTVLGQSESVPRQRAAAVSRRRQLDAWLESRSRDELLSLVREHLADDRDLRRRLELRAATAGDDFGAVRERVLSLLDTRAFARYGYIEYADAHAYGQQAAEAVTALRTLTDSGRAADAVEASREAMRALGRTYGEIDDSDGVIGTVASGLAEAHLDACRAARPDPVRTADWLVEHLLGDLNDATDIDLSDYTDVLGEPGLARARELVAEAWRRNPKGWAEKYLMEQLLRSEGSVDALIAVHAADLSPTGATHLLIAQELERAGRPAESLEWAERGLREAGPDHGPDPRLVEFVCERYLRAGRPADVVTVHRDVLKGRRSLAAYQALRTAARTTGRWDGAERTSALDLLRADADADARSRKSHEYGGSVLVDALIDDGDHDAAWQAAVDGYADQRQWLTLADRLRDRRPADALTVYLRHIAPFRTRTGDSAYERLTELLLSARACHRALGTEDEFTAYLAGLRADQKRKRKLMAMLDRHGL